MGGIYVKGATAAICGSGGLRRSPIPGRPGSSASPRSRLFGDREAGAPAGRCGRYDGSHLSALRLGEPPLVGCHMAATNDSSEEDGFRPVALIDGVAH